MFRQSWPKAVLLDIIHKHSSNRLLVKIKHAHTLPAFLHIWPVIRSSKHGYREAAVLGWEAVLENPRDGVIKHIKRELGGAGGGRKKKTQREDCINRYLQHTEVLHHCPEVSWSLARITLSSRRADFPVSWGAPLFPYRLRAARGRNFCVKRCPGKTENGSSALPDYA